MHSSFDRSESFECAASLSLGSKKKLLIHRCAYSDTKISMLVKKSIEATVDIIQKHLAAWGQMTLYMEENLCP